MANLIFDGDYLLTSRYGWRRTPYSTFGIQFHKGVDYAMPIGTPLLARDNGIVSICSNNDGYGGKWGQVTYSDGSASRYFHLSQHVLPLGAKVTIGDVVFLSGNTGKSTGPHLHYEDYKDANNGRTHRDPLPIITQPTLPITDIDMKEYRRGFIRSCVFANRMIQVRFVGKPEYIDITVRSRPLDKPNGWTPWFKDGRGRNEPTFEQVGDTLYMYVVGANDERTYRRFTKDGIKWSNWTTNY